MSDGAGGGGPIKNFVAEAATTTGEVVAEAVKDVGQAVMESATGTTQTPQQQQQKQEELDKRKAQAAHATQHWQNIIAAQKKVQLANAEKEKQRLSEPVKAPTMQGANNPTQQQQADAAKAQGRSVELAKTDSERSAGTKGE